MNTVKGVGKTVEAAIEDALAQLGATQDQVTIKILSEGGLFKKAQVEVTLDEAEKKARKVSFDNFEPEVNVKAGSKIEEPVAKAKGGAKPKAKVTPPAVDVKVDVETKIKNKNEESKKISGVDNKTAEKVLTETINEILKYVKAEGLETKFNFDDKAIYIEIIGEKLGALIGVGGETLNSLESYLNASASTANITKRIRVDVGGYRKQKEDKLVKMAEKAYQIAVKSGKYKFDPMSARERRIIHAALQGHEDVTTYSKGNEPKRFVIVEKTK